MEELGEVMREFDKIKLNEQEIMEKIRRIEQKNSNIRGITGASFNTNNMLKRWDNLQMASLEMGNILQDQRNRLQQDTLRKSEALEHEAARVYKKYEQIRPREEQLDREQVMELYSRIKDWQGEWREVEQKFEAISKDIAHFGMRLPDFGAFRQIKQKLERELGNWLFFMQYRDAVEQLEPEEWITFRGNLNRYADLVTEYSAKAKEIAQVDQVAKLIREVLEENRQTIALLRCLTG
jgi:hypothetical protein